ncbi:MAG: penicillin-binding protein 2 [Gammaproteobacteria bacterium]|nr:MAG: penicillin-binding protein 2 [Gammaproteobacteria bacterium]
MPAGRRRLLLGLLGLAAAALAWRVVDLQLSERGFLQGQGEARTVRVVALPAVRGMITDRRGEPLAVSTPVDSVWADPRRLLEAAGAVPWGALGRALGEDAERLRRRVRGHAGRAFVYLRRHLPPEQAQRVLALGIPGVGVRREYRRYYPTGEVSAHVLGFTDIDDVGQEGLELAYDRWLRGRPGSMRVIKDRLGRVVEVVEQLREPRPGRDLHLSLDRRLQYLAYRELKAAVRRHRARGGSVVLLDVGTGEVLAMANQPGFNPNSREGLRAGLRGAALRNRAVTDVFEPGSTVKPFTVAAALASGRFRPDSPVDTRPGWWRIGGYTVRDVRNHGLIDLRRVVVLSSNVGAGKVALALPPRALWEAFARVGLGRPPGSGFPGEAPGRLPDPARWYPVERASFAYGYGLAVSALQLARAYACLAAGGVLRPVSLLRLDRPPPGRRVMDPGVARQVTAMLEEAVREGTGRAARVRGYRVAGKTGTARKLAPGGGYARDRYRALFAGFAPASHPRLALVVVVDEPQEGGYYGGQVAAPVFARIMAGALRLLDVAPDDLPGLGGRLAAAGGGHGA